jgi:hypothetical protein
MVKEKAPERMAIKMSKATVDRVRELSALVSRVGWESLGIERSDPATMTAVIEAAVDMLYGHAHRKRK